jgi:hypothetical protein
MESSCAFKLLVETGSIEVTFLVFWLVIAVIAVNPYASRLENVLISLCIPAPEDGSEPPMERMFIFVLNYPLD